MLTKIISGGQTGVDRAALDAALYNDFPCGGYCPKGRLAEDGSIHREYPLNETKSNKYPPRTLLNIEESNGTVIIVKHTITGGSALTKKLCQDKNKPVHVIKQIEHVTTSAAKEIIEFIKLNEIATLNVAGQRASKWPNAHAFTFMVMNYVIKSDICHGSIKSIISDFQFKI